MKVALNSGDEKKARNKKILIIACIVLAIAAFGAGIFFVAKSLHPKSDNNSSIYEANLESIDERSVAEGIQKKESGESNEDGKKSEDKNDENDEYNDDGRAKSYGELKENLKQYESSPMSDMSEYFSDPNKFFLSSQSPNGFDEVEDRIFEKTGDNIEQIYNLQSLISSFFLSDSNNDLYTQDILNFYKTLNLTNSEETYQILPDNVITVSGACCYTPYYLYNLLISGNDCASPYEMKEEITNKTFDEIMGIVVNENHKINTPLFHALIEIGEHYDLKDVQFNFELSAPINVSSDFWPVNYASCSYVIPFKDGNINGLIGFDSNNNLMGIHFD